MQKLYLYLSKQHIAKMNNNKIFWDLTIVDK